MLCCMLYGFSMEFDYFSCLQLTNIIWGEAGDSEDGIVPLPEGNVEKKTVFSENHRGNEAKQDYDTFQDDQEEEEENNDFQGKRVDVISNFDSNDNPHSSGLGIDSWLGLSLSNSGKTDLDYERVELSSSIDDLGDPNSSQAVGTPLEKDIKIFQNQLEDKEQADFEDCGWANIGSFDDLARIFSISDDPFLGHVSLDNADELWSASKDFGSTPEKSPVLAADSSAFFPETSQNAEPQYENEGGCVQHSGQSLIPGQRRFSGPQSYHIQVEHASTNRKEYTEEESNSTLKEERVSKVGETAASNSGTGTKMAVALNKLSDKVNKRSKVLKLRKKLVEKNQGKSYVNSRGTWSTTAANFQQYENPVVASVFGTTPASALGQQTQLLETNYLPHHCISHQYLAPSIHGTIDGQFLGMPLFPSIHPGESDNYQQVLSSYEVSPDNANQLNKFPDVSAKPLTMTPQEKIEKLKRRQQMQAMLAIQKQQMQFQNKACGSRITSLLAEQRLQDNMKQQSDGANFNTRENLSSLQSHHSCDQYSHFEREDMNAISIAVDKCSMEDTILHHLLTIIAKLDVKVRRCIQDSLFRLAQSAGLRQCSNGKTSTFLSRREDDVEKRQVNRHDRCARTDAETETNPIDRFVAHLLFHGPLETPVKNEVPPETFHPPSEKIVNASLNLQTGCCPGSSEDGQKFSSQESESQFSAILHQQRSECINKSVAEASENAITKEPPDSEFTEVEMPQ